MRIPALLLLVTAPAFAQDRVTAEQALSNYRKVMVPTAELDCPRGDDGEEIVVCGKRKGEKSPYRLPLPVEREPGARIPGEALSGGFGCIRMCPKPVGIDLEMIFKAAKAIKNKLEEDR
jgi:hypothetical protein